MTIPPPLPDDRALNLEEVYERSLGRDWKPASVMVGRLCRLLAEARTELAEAKRKAKVLFEYGESMRHDAFIDD